MADAESRLVFNPLDGSLEVRFGTTGVTIDGVEAELVFERMTEDGESALALWVEPREADVLAKMIRYILDKVRITAASKEALEALLPRVEAIAAEASEAAGDSSA